MAMELPTQITRLIESLQLAETDAKDMMQTAHANRLSFGFRYNSIDDDIARLIRELRYMLTIAQRHAAAPGSDNHHTDE